MLKNKKCHSATFSGVYPKGVTTTKCSEKFIKALFL